MYDFFFDGFTGEIEEVHDHKSLIEAVGVFQTKFDSFFRGALAQTGETIACKEGCFYCCHFKVDVLPHEAFAIADFIRRKFTQKEQFEVQERAARAWERIEPLTTAGQQGVAGIQCSMLKNGRCSVYPVRPILCRSCHSRSVEPCKNSFAHPDAERDAFEPISELKLQTSDATKGTGMAVQNQGYDASPYDLNGAVFEALTNPKSEKRWRDKKSAFPSQYLAKDYVEWMQSRQPGSGVET